MSTPEKSLPQDDAFTVWVNRPAWGTQQLERQGAIIKRGQLVTKTVELTKYGDGLTGEIKKRELRFRAHAHRKGHDPDYDEPDPKASWYCEGDEIERVLAFLQSNVARTGRYRIVDTNSAAGIILDLLQDGDCDAGSADLAEVLLQYGEPENLVSVLSSSDRGASIAQLAVLAKRQRLVQQLQTLVRHSAVNETEIQRLIGQSYWIFGGRYVGISRRDLIPLDQHDIPLIGADGTLHIVELKSPRIPKLVRRHRNHWIVGNEINEAVGQAMGYIRGCDELGPAMSTYYKDELGLSYGMRRVFATVIIGHPEHVTEVDRSSRKADESVINDAIRTYNSHLSRVEVRTYKDLVDAAERSLAFESESMATTQGMAAVEENGGGPGHEISAGPTRAAGPLAGH